MIYLIFGDNTFETERRVKELAAKFDCETEKADGSELTPEQLPDLVAGVTLFSSQRLIVIKQASQNKPVWTALGEWFEKGVENDIILVETSLDKRTKTYKWLQKNAAVTETKELKPFEAAAWLVETAQERGVSLARDTAAYLVEYVGVDQWQLSGELDKLVLSGQPVTKEKIQQLVESSPQATSFELLDATFRGQDERAENLFAVVSRQEDPYMFFGLLSSQIYAAALMAHARGMSPESVAKAAGMHPFVLKKIQPLAQSLTRQQLRELTLRLAELDSNIKSRSVAPWTQIHSFLRSLYLEN